MIGASPIARVGALALTALALAGGLAAARLRHAPVIAPRSSPPPLPADWTPIPRDAPLATAKAAALLDGSALVGDGAKAELLDGATRVPIDAPVPLPRLFAAGGRLFAASEVAGSAFLVAMQGQEPTAVSTPCKFVALAGRGDLLAAACEDGGIAVSRDGARTFERVAFRWPSPPEAPVEVANEVDGLAVSAEGRLAMAGAVRWTARDTTGAPRLWSHSQVSWTSGPVWNKTTLKAVPVPRALDLVGLQFVGETLYAAVVEASEEGPRPRLVRLSAEGAFPIGAPGPVCPLSPTVERWRGAAMTPTDALFLCQGDVVRTSDAGETWRTERFPKPILELVAGTSARAVARTGEEAYELRLEGRLASGAAGRRVEPAVEEAVKARSHAPPPPDALKNATPLPTHTPVREPPPGARAAP